MPVYASTYIDSASMGVVQLLGEGVVRRFVQDTCQWGPLSLTMAGMLLSNPLLIMRVVGQVGTPAHPPALLESQSRNAS